jgi:2-methylisocitrate lyase-like PEP mutase family enzyme
MSNLAEKFHSLHKQPDLLILPNAWDAASARVIEAAGAKAIATTSAGVAWALGYRDGDVLPPRMLAEAAARIRNAIKVPLSVDFEGGYTKNPGKIAENLKPILQAGAVGINIEDGNDAPDLLAKKIEKARKAADSARINLFINARTDVYLKEIGNPKDRVNEVIKRAALYLEAGASGLFVPAVTEAAAIKAIASGIKMPLNVLARPNLPKAKELKKLGVSRLSAGSGISQVIWSLTTELASQFLAKGDSAIFGTSGLNYGKIQSLFEG